MKGYKAFVYCKYRQQALAHNLILIYSKKTINSLFSYFEGGVEKVNVLITGSTGFVGTALCKFLKQKGFDVFALARRESIYKIAHIKGIEIIPTDISSPESLSISYPQADVVVHLAGIFREFKRKKIDFETSNFLSTKHALIIAEKISARKFIFLSALGASPYSKIKFLRSKSICEELIKNFPFDYLILRTPLIYGKGDNSTAHFIKLANSSIVPLIANRHKKIKPLFVEDLLEAIHTIIKEDNTISRTLDLEGPQEMTYKEMIETIAKISGKTPHFFYLPRIPLRLVTRALERFSFYPISSDQLSMMDEEEVKSEDFLKYYPIERHSYMNGIKKILGEA
ncbi:MAG: NAD-dependent epimerase/dehydratase family protein [Candidatus Schekmanbacteria bacterium]|nr:MAG: NAD-dependent epimerase/dehydratase family protein [Candidatus Schekmanbacteria bacterium]